MNLPEGLIRIYLRIARANAPFMTEEGARAEVHHQALRPGSYNPPKKIRPDVTITVDRDGEYPVYTVAPTDGAPSGHVIYAHGGGWVHEIRPQHWALITQIAAEARIAVTVPIWKLLPYGDATQACELMLRLHDRLQRGGGDVQFAGDSAGGQIALSAALVLRNQGVKNVRTVLISPVLDLTISHPQIPAVLPRDPWLGVAGMRVLTSQWAGELALTDPKVSPIFGDMHGLGPMLIATGTDDILNPDAHLLADKARAAGVEVTLIERDGAVHAFPLLPTRAGQAARARIIDAFRG